MVRRGAANKGKAKADYHKSTAQRAAHWLLIALTVVMVVTGFGIADYRAVEALSLGLLTKAVSFQAHMLVTAWR